MSLGDEDATSVSVNLLTTDDERLTSGEYLTFRVFIKPPQREMRDFRVSMTDFMEIRVVIETTSLQTTGGVSSIWSPSFMARQVVEGQTPIVPSSSSARNR